MRARAGPLAADEVAVAGRGAALAGGDFVGVHAEARRAARFAPFEAGFDERPMPGDGVLVRRVDKRAIDIEHGRGRPGAAAVRDWLRRTAHV